MDTLLLNPTIGSFLSKYPESRWVECIEVTSVIGINSVQAKRSSMHELWSLASSGFQYPPSLSQLDSKLNALKNELRSKESQFFNFSEARSKRRNGQSKHKRSRTQHVKVDKYIFHG